MDYELEVRNSTMALNCLCVARNRSSQCPQLFQQDMELTGFEGARLAIGSKVFYDECKIAWANAAHMKLSYTVNGKEKIHGFLHVPHSRSRQQNAAEDGVSMYLC